MDVGIIGTGLLGSAIAKRIVSSGHKVHAYNRTRQKAEPLRKLGIEIEDSPEELAKNATL